MFTKVSLCDGVTVEGYYTAPVEPYEGATFEIDKVLICEGVDCYDLWCYLDTERIERECIALVEETIKIEKAMEAELMKTERVAGSDGNRNT